MPIVLGVYVVIMMTMMNDVHYCYCCILPLFVVVSDDD